MTFWFHFTSFSYLLWYYDNLYLLLEYTKVFSQDVSKKLFTSYDGAGNSNPTNPDAPIFSILNQLENYRNRDGKFRLKLCYPEITWGVNGDNCNEWYQTSNPYTDSTISGYEMISLAFEIISSEEPFVGLGKNADGMDEKAFIDASPATSYESSRKVQFFIIGGKNYWPQPNDSNSTIAGPYHPNVSAKKRKKLSAISKVELYVLVWNWNIFWTVRLNQFRLFQSQGYFTTFQTYFRIINSFNFYFLD